MLHWLFPYIILYMYFSMSFFESLLYHFQISPHPSAVSYYKLFLFKLLPTSFRKPQTWWREALSFEKLDKIIHIPSTVWSAGLLFSHFHLQITPDQILQPGSGTSFLLRLVFANTERFSNDCRKTKTVLWFNREASIQNTTYSTSVYTLARKLQTSYFFTFVSPALCLGDRFC